MSSQNIINLNSNDDDGIPVELTNEFKDDQSVESINCAKKTQAHHGEFDDTESIVEDDIDDHLSRVKLILLLKRYLLTFPEELKHLKCFESKFDKTETKKLNNILAEMRMIIRNSNSTDFILTTGGVVLNNIENILTSSGINVKGLTATCLTNDGYIKALKEISLEYPQFTNTSAKTQLLFMSGAIGYSVYNHNNKLIEQKAPTNDEKPE
jgi:hypothetical protein